MEYDLNRIVTIYDGKFDILDLPEHILLNIINYIDITIDLALTCKRFYQLVCWSSRNNIPLKLCYKELCDPQIYASVIQSERQFDELNIDLCNCQLLTDIFFERIVNLLRKYGPKINHLKLWNSMQSKPTEMSQSMLYEVLSLTKNIEKTSTKHKQKLSKMALIKYMIAISTGIFLRSTISLHSYSGENNPPMYGDFEAQRHWQEVTVNLPVKDWYENTTDNDLQYWGLDYPPLTAYHSYTLGQFAKFINESYVALHTSRGISTDDHKFFMRNTVLISDILLYIPAMLLACHVIFSKLLKLNRNKSESFYWLYVLIALNYPGQLLIDNGHFQYNNMSLGLTVLAVTSILLDKRIIGAVFFVFALNYKQMELYHAVPFFCYLLSNCFVESDKQHRHSVIGGLMRLIKLGIVVVMVFVIIWLPWLSSMSSFLQVIHRIFPIYRGVFEDKVSNVWCIVNVFMKIKDNFTNEEMAKICLGCTATALVPCAVNLLFNPRKKQFLYALINSSLAFFLFSFQVHEKSILIVAIPVILIFPLEPFMAFWFLQISTFSMIPLLVKDGLITAYIGLSGMFFLMNKIIIDNARSEKQKDMNFLQILWNINFNKSSKWIEKLFIAFYVLSSFTQLILFIGYFYLTPPEHLPFLHPLLISAFSCCHFIFFMLYFNIKQLLLS